MLGVMFDCSRNAVMTVDTVKKYADILKKWDISDFYKKIAEKLYSVTNKGDALY